MGIKAQITGVANPGSRSAGGSSPSPAPAASSDAVPLEPSDELVMVLFPRVAWQAVLELAKDLHVAPAEAVGAALRLLRERVDEEADRVT